jgi:regulator of protease activity HflC (stomatin/prohibitin superfamily)
VGDLVLSEGLHFYNPLSSEIIEMNVQEQKYGNETITYTKDTQKVILHSVLNHYPDPSRMNEFYQKYGLNWESKLIPQVVLGSIKDVIGKINADDLNGARDRTAQQIESEIEKKLTKIHISVRGFELTSIAFEHDYEKAVEAKVIATQKAIEAKNRTAEVKEQASQRLIEAKSMAESMKIRSEALSRNRSLVEYEAVQKWNGQLPQIMMGDKGLPFIQLNLKDLDT